MGITHERNTVNITQLHLWRELGERASGGTEPAFHTAATGQALEGETSGIGWECASGRGERNMARDAEGGKRREQEGWGAR